MQVAAAHQLHVAALDQRTVGCQPTLRLGQVDHWREDLLAVHLDLFQPHDVVGQRRHLLRAQTHAQLQLELVLVSDGVVHQVAEQRLVAAQPVDVALAGARHHRVADQPLLVETVAETLLASVRVHAQAAEQVVRVEELLQFGERRVGLDQILVAGARRGVAGHALDPGDARQATAERAAALTLDVGRASQAVDSHALALPGTGGVAGALLADRDAATALGAVGAGTERGAAIAVLGEARAETEQAVVTLGQAEAGQGNRVDLAPRQVGRQLRGQRHDHRNPAAAHRAVAHLAAAADEGVAGAGDAVVDARAGIDRDIAGGLDHRCVGLVATADRGRPLAREFVLEGPVAEDRVERGGDLARARRVEIGALVPVEVGEVARLLVDAADIAAASGTQHADGFQLAGFQALVVEDFEVGGEVAAAADQTGKVVQGAAVDGEVASGQQLPHGAAGGDLGLVALGDGPDGVALAAAVARVDAFDAGGLLHLRGVQARLAFQHGATVLDQAGTQAEVLAALDHPGKVAQAGGTVAGIVAGDIQPAEAVHIPVEVGDVAGAQGHVGATEQQSALVEQGGRVQSQVAAAAQGAVVVQARGAGHEVAGGGDPPTVDQQVAGAERDIGAAGEAGGIAEVEAGGVQGEVAEAGGAAVATVAAAQLEAQAAVAGQQAVVAPVAAAASEGLHRQQLALGRLAEGADVQVQASGLQHAAVGPFAGADVQQAIGGQFAAGADHLPGIQAEGAVAGMEDAPAGVGQAAQLQVEVLVGAFQHAVGVVQAASDQPRAAAAAEGAQAAAAVVDRGGAQVQLAFAFQLAEAVGQRAGQAEVDAPGADLAALTRRRALVEEALAVEAEQAAGVEAATLVVEVDGDDAVVAAQRRDMALLVAHALPGADFQRLRLGDAGAVVEQPGDQLQPTLGAVEHAAGAVVEAAALQV